VLLSLVLVVIYFALVVHTDNRFGEDESSLIAFRRLLEGFKYAHVRTDLRLILACTHLLPGRPILAFYPPTVATNPDHICPESLKGVFW
jgi:hypothetical protein